MKKQAKKALRGLEAAISKLPNVPGTFTYVGLWHEAQQLFCQKDYALAYVICLETIDSINRLV